MLVTSVIWALARGVRGERDGALDLQAVGGAAGGLGTSEQRRRLNGRPTGRSLRADPAELPPATLFADTLA